MPTGTGSCTGTSSRRTSCWARVTRGWRTSVWREPWKPQAVAGSPKREWQSALPYYMSPEQVGGDPVDARSDIYSLGSVLYEMLAGEAPFSGRTAQAIIAKRLSEPAPSVRSARPAVTQPLERAVARALAVLPADRFSTAGDFAAALEGSSAPSDGRRPHRTQFTRSRLTLLALLAAAAVGVAYLLWHRASQLRLTRDDHRLPAAEADGASTDSVPSVAVLPLVNLTAERSDEYFSDGMTEELITALSKVEGLRVAARTSAFTFKGRNADIREIGEKLQVGTVLEGSVRRSGRRLRVTAQLINVADGYHLWSESYDRELTDIFAVQDELARAIVAALRGRLKLPEGPAGTLVKTATVDPLAHDLYLQGRFFWNQRTRESLLTAARYFERAIARDSSYAEAHAALADAYVVFPNYFVATPSEAYPKAKAAAARSLSLDSTLAYAHATLAVVREEYEWDWQGAEQEFRQAIALNPSYATAHQWYAEYLGSLGRHREALVEADLAVRLDPLSGVIAVDRAAVLLRAGRPDDAIAQLRATRETDPEFAPVYNVLGWAYLVKGMYAKALAELTAATRMTGRRNGIGRLAYAYARSGQRDSALMIVRELRERSRHEYVPDYHLILAYAGLGEKDQALASLEKSADMREPSLVLSILTDPLFQSLRSDPRYARLLTRMGLK